MYDRFLKSSFSLNGIKYLKLKLSEGENHEPAI